jgi:hypothetical protein
MNSMLPVLMLGTQLLLPASDQVPKLNVALSCKAATAIAVADAQSYNGCMKDEMSARQQLLELWPSVSLSEKARCTSEATAGGIDSYVDLLVCLQMSQDVAADEKIKLKGARRK